MIKDLFFVDFRQLAVIKMNLIINTISVLIMLSLFSYPSLIAYSMILLASASLNILLSCVYLKRYFSFQITFGAYSSAKRILKNTLMNFAIWNHLTGSVATILYKIDILILSLFAALSAVGDYTIAVSIAELFLFITIILQKPLHVSFSRLDSKASIEIAMGIFLKYFLAIALLQVTVFYFFGWHLVRIFTSESADQIFSYSLMIIIGISMLTILRPLGILAAVKTNMRDQFMEVHMPAGIAGTLSYFYLSYMFGPIGAAAGNIVAYSILSLLSLFYVTRHYPLKPKFKLVTPQEKEIAIKIKRFTKGIIKSNFGALADVKIWSKKGQ